MLIVIASLPGKSDKRDECRAALTKMAVASRGEPGCIAYSFSVDLENPDRYVSVELWEDQASLDAHFGTPHVAELIGAQLSDGDVEITTYTVA